MGFLDELAQSSYESRLRRGQQRYEKLQEKREKRLGKEAGKFATQLKGRRPVDPGEVSLTSVDLRGAGITASDGRVYPTFTWPNHAFDQYEFHTAIVYDPDTKQEIARIDGPAAATETPTAFDDCARAVARELPAKLNRYLYEQANTVVCELGNGETLVAVLERDGSLNARLVRDEDQVTLASAVLENVGVSLPASGPPEVAVDTGKPEIAPLTFNSSCPADTGAGIDGPSQSI